MQRSKSHDRFVMGSTKNARNATGTPCAEEEAKAWHCKALGYAGEGS